MEHCGHEVCKSSEGEEFARSIAAVVLNDSSLLRVCEVEPADENKPDFRSERHAVEVKRLASPSLVSFQTAHDRHVGGTRHFTVPSLHRVWGVIPDVTTAAESFDPTPTPSLKQMVRKLTPLLERLEARGLTDALQDSWIAGEVASLTGQLSSCSVMPEAPWPGPGIVVFGYGHGHSRTTNLESDVVAFLQEWLSSSASENAKQSLANEGERHRVVVLVASPDGPSSGMVRTLSENPDTPLQTPLRLPANIDALIVITPYEVLDYGLTDQWRRERLPSR